MTREAPCAKSWPELQAATAALELRKSKRLQAQPRGQMSQCKRKLALEEMREGRWRDEGSGRKEGRQAGWESQRKQETEEAAKIKKKRMEQEEAADEGSSAGI